MNPTKADPRILVAGHICLDITPVFGPASGLDSLVPGRLVEVGPADIHTGGAVANTGLALRILGADAALVGKVGNDALGELVRQVLSRHGAGGNLLVAKGESTSYSVVLAPPGTDRIFLHNPGANNSFGSTDITDVMLAGVSHFHFGYPPLMRRMYENGGRELIDLFTRVHRQNITTSLDMAAIDPASPAAAVGWAALLEALLPFVDFFVPSAEEICWILDPARHADWLRRAAGRDVNDILDPEADIAPLARRLLRMGAGVVLIKCGAPGLYYAAGTAQRLAAVCAAHSLDTTAWAGLAGFEKSYRPDAVLSATGAGDTSIAGFLAGLLQGTGLVRCAQLAAACGACCVASYDALSGLCSLEDLAARIDGGWPKADGSTG